MFAVCLTTQRIRKGEVFDYNSGIIFSNSPLKYMYWVLEAHLKCYISIKTIPLAPPPPPPPPTKKKKKKKKKNPAKF